MKDLKRHRETLKEIADYAFAYGIQNTDIDFSKYEQRSEIPKHLREEFTHNCHEGFKKAQKLIIDEIFDYQEELNSLKPKLKQARRDHDDELEEKISIQQKIVEQRINTFSHVADSLAWQLLNGEIHVARRFSLEQQSQKNLKHSNIEHAIEVADKINKSPNNFALISDLTNFVQIGDLLVRAGQSCKMIELKQGKVNTKIMKFLDSLEEKGEKLEEVDLENHFDKKTIKQVKRVSRQKERMKQVSKIINTDEGIDPVSKTKMELKTPKVPTVYYHEELTKMHLELDEKNWSYRLIEGCIHIGMYKDEAIKMAPFIIERLLKDATENYMIIDWMSITNNVSEPIFAKPFSPDFIIDVLTGHVKVIIGLDFDNLIELFNNIGLKTKWLTEKETMHLKQKKVRDGMVEVNNRAIQVEPPNTEDNITLFGGTISKLLYDNIKPSNIAHTLLTID